MANDKNGEPAGGAGVNAPTPTPASVATPPAALVDDFGLPIRRFVAPEVDVASEDDVASKAEDKSAIKHEDAANKGDEGDTDKKLEKGPDENPESHGQTAPEKEEKHEPTNHTPKSSSDIDEAEFKDAQSVLASEPATPSTTKPDMKKTECLSKSAEPSQSNKDDEKELTAAEVLPNEVPVQPMSTSEATREPTKEDDLGKTQTTKDAQTRDVSATEAPTKSKAGHNRELSTASASHAVGVSEFSHQQISTHPDDNDKGNDDDAWQEMPAYARYDMYDDDDRLIAREHEEGEEETYAYGGLGGAGKGYTRVFMDEDAESATSMDDNTQYLFQKTDGTSLNDEVEARDAVSQMQATKDLLTEGQRIAYVGIVRLGIVKLLKDAEGLEITKKTKKEVTTGAEAVKMWGQKMMIRLYAHMDISEAEQVMIEQLADHGVLPQDLTPTLMVNSRVQNPMAEDKKKSNGESNASNMDSPPPYPAEEKAAEMPPPYESCEGGDLTDVKTPSQLPKTDKIDIDLRWTVLCDLFLLLIADSIYDARSRVLLEEIASNLEIPWIDICKFEKKVTDALEMQQAAEKENWNEDEHMEARRKLALKKRYLMMGLATVGGGLVIGLSAGLLAPVIGAGLAAGFTTIGVTGTGSFLAGAGGAAIITSGAAASGSLIGGRAANRRTGAVKTFEYRPLHNNKRVNLIVTVSGWLTGKVDDVRLPFSTVDPIMGDLYSVLWEPEMLRSMGDTMNILATEALTQGLQQILGNTVLISLMAALQLPLVLTKLSYLIDNPWAVSLDRAVSAGKILADSLIERSLGTRPITLVGYSIGSRVIFSCLKELAKKGAYGLVQNVYLFGSPIVVKKEEYLRARTVVSGRFVNAFNRNDWILGYLFRLTNGGIRRVAGLAPIEDCPWIENMDVTELVAGHMDYRKAMPSLLIKCGWSVESEEFTEIEDPDPENHQERQRELINEIEEARRELEKEGKASKGGRFSLFGRRKKADRQEWEVYEDSAGKDSKDGKDGAIANEKNDSNHGVLFDIDAIRAELAKEAYNVDTELLQVREIKSTLPPMKLDIAPLTSTAKTSPTAPDGPRDTLRGSKSVDVLPLRSSNEIPKPRESSAWASNTRSVSSAYHRELGPAEDDEIQMTFDTSFEAPKYSHYFPDDDMDGPSNRPEIKSSQTLPNVTLQDPWGDMDDEDFGKEKEISMTFA